MGLGHLTPLGTLKVLALLNITSHNNSAVVKHVYYLIKLINVGCPTFVSWLSNICFPDLFLFKLMGNKEN